MLVGKNGDRPEILNLQVSSPGVGLRAKRTVPVVADIHPGEIPQAAVWPFLVVMLTPGFYDASGMMNV